jgi:predicted flap endonuclease-1-like 5' DNA nuclease
MIGRSLAVDDLKVVEGIGPKIEQLLNDRGVRTWHDLSVADVDRLRDILQEAGARYRMHDPSTWPQQATLLARGDWEAFTALNNGDPDA